MSDPVQAKTAAVTTAPGMELLVEVPVPGVRIDRLAHWATRLVSELTSEASTLLVRLTDDATVASLNERYRSQEGPTDVLSFPGGETPEGRHLGDIVVAVPTALRQAAARAHPLEQEIKTLVLHGVLHCLGYDHEDDEGQMNRLEAQLRPEWVGPDE